MEVTKYCPKCHTRKNGTEFYKSKHTTDGLAGYCKECVKQISRININKLENEFICSNCQSNDFSKKKRKDSSSSICYICHNKYDEKNISTI